MISSNDQKRLLPFVALSLVSILLLLHERFVYAPCDDAYIFLVYVRNLLEGNGLTYNGDFVQGFSSIAWPWVLAMLGFIRIPLPDALTVASTLAGLFTLFAAYGASRKAGATRCLALLPPLLLACSSDFAFYASNGMETPLFAGLLLLCCALVFEPPEDRTLSRHSTALLLFLLPLVRPEGALFGALIVLWIAFAQRDLAGLVKLALKLILAWAPVLLSLRYFYGHWLPATYYAKSGAGLANLGYGIEYSRLFVTYYWPVLVALLASLVTGYRDLNRPLIPIALVILLWITQVTVQGGDNMVGLRAYVPILPLIYVLLAHLMRKAPLWINAVGALALGLYLFANYNFGTVFGGTWGQTVKQQAAGWSQSYQERLATGLWMKAHLPVSAVTALNPAGITPYYSQLPTIDMLGLNNIQIATHGRRDRSIPYGHQVGDGAYVLSLKPTAIWFSGAGASASGLVSDREVWQNPVFREHYAPCQITAKTWLWIEKQTWSKIVQDGACLSVTP